MSTDPLLHLRDPQPPAPDSSTLARVRRRARQRQRRRLAVGAAAVALTVLAASSALAISRREPEVVVASDGATTSTSGQAAVTSAPPLTGFVPSGEVRHCFPEAVAAVPPAPETAASIGGAGSPDGAPPLLALTSRGQVWVLHGTGAQLWTPPSGSTAHRYLWARWEDAGTILASRLVETPAVVLDRLTAPGQATTVVSLPYTVSDQAPAGFCPIDGHLATFAVRPEGVVLARHRPGPIPHSCPALHTAGRWACQSPQGVSFELRATAGIDQPGTGVAGFIGSFEPTRLVADAERGSTFASLTGDTISVVRPGTQPECCSGGQRGSSFSLAPEGDRLAYSPDGTDVRVAELGRTGDSGSSVWKAPVRITATAFTSAWLAVAYGGTLALVSPDGARRLHLATPLLEGVTSLDWAA